MLRVLILFLVSAGLASARDLPWIGVVLAETTKEERVGLDLGTGVGLRVAKVSDEGPYRMALGEEGDLWWKFDGQILLSRCQMVVLLRSKNPGDEVEVKFYRGGNLETVQLTLGVRPERKMYSARGVRGDVGPESQRALLTHRQEVARVNSNGHQISLEKTGQSLKFEVRKGEELVLSQLMADSSTVAGVPTEWLESFHVLKMTMDQRAASPSVATKKRVRYVPRNNGGKE